VTALSVEQEPMSESTGLKAVLIAERPLLVRLMRARIDPPEDAEDLWQELWLKVDTLPSGPVADPVSFLCRMAINLTSDRRRSKGRAAARDSAWQAHQPSAAEYPSPERELVARDQLKQVERVIADMPDRTREALRQFRLEGQSQRDIATSMGITVSGVEKLLKRAYRLLGELQIDPSADDAGRQRLMNEGAPSDD
jgi:RNA polymerase sigma factor (sigma-70 family)